MPLYFLVKEDFAKQLSGKDELAEEKEKKEPATAHDFEASMEEEQDLQEGREMWGEDFWMQ